MTEINNNSGAEPLELQDNLHQMVFSDANQGEVDIFSELIECIEEDTADNEAILALSRENVQLKEKIAQLEIAKTQVYPEDYQQLLAQLQASNHTLQSQQVMIKTLSQQLAETQAQLANLERECSQVQDSYNQQTYKLIETEKQIQELHSRLLRQQRYTLEYKTTLEECFENTTNKIIATNEEAINHKPSQNPETSQEIDTTPDNSQKTKAHWPSPGIETHTLVNHPKVKRHIDLPTFLK